MKEIYAAFEILRDAVMKSSTFWDIRREIRWKSNDISEEHVASILRFEVLEKQQRSKKHTASRSLKMDATYSSATLFEFYRTPRYPVLFYCFAFTSILSMAATCSSETSVEFHWTARRCIPEDGTLEIKFSFCHVLSVLYWTLVVEMRANISKRIAINKSLAANLRFNRLYFIKYRTTEKHFKCNSWNL
jgi:hypothetical protein